MSYSQLILFRNGAAEDDIKFKNSHGTGPAVWDALVTKYRKLIYPNDPITSPIFRLFTEEWADLWIVADPDGKNPLPLKWWEWVALQWTYDGALCKREDLEMLSEALRQFEEALIVKGRVSHLSAFARRCRQIAAHEGEVEAVGLYPTSVIENPWIGYKEETDEMIPYNLHEENGVHPFPMHWFYSRYPSVERECGAEKT